MANETILVAEDDVDIQELRRQHLSKEGYRVLCADTGDEALLKVVEEWPNLILLDLMLPGIGGLDICRDLKSDARTARIPIIVVTAKDDEVDMVTCLEVGADEYLVKAFTPTVLLTIIRAVLRRARRSNPVKRNILHVREITVDLDRHEVAVDGREVRLTVSDFKILHLLAKRPEWVYSREQIIESLRGPNYPETDRSVDVQISGLRKKLGEVGHFIETVRGAATGSRSIAPMEAAALCSKDLQEESDKKIPQPRGEDDWGKIWIRVESSPWSLQVHPKGE